MNPDEIKITFTLSQVNAVLHVLGQMPYGQVAELINGIKAIAEPQVPREEQKEAA